MVIHARNHAQFLVRSQNINPISGLCIAGVIVMLLLSCLLSNVSATWDSTATQISTDDILAEAPDITNDGYAEREDDVYIVWQEQQYISMVLYTYIKFDFSYDSGETWEGPITIASTSGSPTVYDPSIAVTVGCIYIAYCYKSSIFPPTPDAVMVAISGDEGESWDYETAYSPSSAGDPRDMANTAIAIQSGCNYDYRLTYEAWETNPLNWLPIERNIYFYSTDFGPTELSGQTNDWETEPDIAVAYDDCEDVDYTYVVWEREKTSNDYIEFIFSPDRGEYWSDIQILSTQPGLVDARYPSVSAMNEYVHVVWSDNRADELTDTSYEIYCYNNNDFGDSGAWSGTYQSCNGVLVSSFNALHKNQPDVAVDEDEDVHVVWQVLLKPYPTVTRDLIYYSQSTNHGVSQSFTNERLISPCSSAPYADACRQPTVAANANDSEVYVGYTDNPDENPQSPDLDQVWYVAT